MGMAVSNTTTHVSLLARVADSADQRAWAEFCERYGELIRNFAARRGLQAADRDDLMQDVLIALTKALPGFTYDPQRGKFRAYLKTIVLRAVQRRFCQSDGAIDLSRIDELTRAASADQDIDAEWEAEWRQYHLRQALERASAEFNRTDLDAFRAYAIDGESADDVARRVGISAESVYQAKSRILRRLSALIEDQVADEG